MDVRIKRFIWIFPNKSCGHFSCLLDEFWKIVLRLFLSRSVHILYLVEKKKDAIDASESLLFSESDLEQDPLPSKRPRKEISAAADDEELSFTGGEQGYNFLNYVSLLYFGFHFFF